MSLVMPRYKPDTAGSSSRRPSHDPDDLRARIVVLLSSGAVAERVRMRLEDRFGGAGREGATDAAGAALTDLLSGFLDETDGGIGVRAYADRDWKEKVRCSRI
jgi:hypothetical protein